MLRSLGWVGIIGAALAGVISSLGTLYLFAPSAPYLWMLIALPLLVGAAIAALLGRLAAPWAGVKRATATVIAAILAILPLGGLVAAMLLSPALPQANAAPIHAGRIEH